VCGAEVGAEASYCPNCGTGLSTAASLAVAQTAAGNAPHPDQAAPDRAEHDKANLIGATISNQFTVEAVIGAGAFGTVYRGRQIGLDRPVAIKVPTHAIAADPVMAKRFAREATSAARIDHPGVVRIYAVGELSDGRPYLAMELVRGEPLDKILGDGPIAPTRALRIIRAIASALSETHAAQVVHRDLKPTNIMWRRDRNGDDLLTIVDFGIAASNPGTADATRLTTGGLLGTPHYMSPEQAHGEDVDARSDIYALGCMLFELITGKPPFDGSGVEVLLAHLGRPPPRPSALVSSVPGVVDRLCASWLAKKPEERPATSDEVVREVDAALAELAAESPSAPRSKSSWGARSRSATASRLERPANQGINKIAVGATAAIAIGTAGFVAWNVLGGTRASTNAGNITSLESNDAASTRTIDADDGEIVIHVRVPERIAKGVLAPIRIELKNKLGQPIATKSLVLTIADDANAKGLTAAPTKSPGSYQVLHVFPHSGRYTLSVFPPSIDSSFEIPLDVR
jgi:serine/threonine protein kinase